MIGQPELTQMTLAPQPATHLTAAKQEKVALPAPTRPINDHSADPTDPEKLLLCGHLSLEKLANQREITPRGPIAIGLPAMLERPGYKARRASKPSYGRPTSATKTAPMGYAVSPRQPRSRGALFLVERLKRRDVAQGIQIGILLRPLHE
jgi:hypothetical protein